ncbi:MFS transporter [Planotetraspora sp. GP83]|uniref:MFS transporter n=1 Tax=Planotetraspora sp. GP83 TaxID=3156264 RepID=UPI0035119BBF
MRANLPLRLARSAAFAVVCVLLAVGAHRFAGGAGPAPQIILWGGLVVMAVSASLAGRERSPSTVIGLLLAAQVFLHELFGPAVTPVGGPHGHRLSVSLGMLIAHLTAALITGWWLARGEAALWGILHRLGAGAIRWLGLLLAVLQADLAGASGPLVVGFERVERPRQGRVLRHSVIRRGPPVLTVF